MPQPDSPANRTTAVDLADAEVARVDVDGTRLIVAFAVIGVAGPGSDYLSAVELVLTELRALRLDPGCLGRVAEAELRIDGARTAPLALPSTQAGPVTLTLHFANGAALRAEGLALQVTAGPDSKRLEHLHC